MTTRKLFNLLITLSIHATIFSALAHNEEVSESDCMSYVKNHIDEFSICSNSGVTKIDGEYITNFKVRGCTRHHSNWVCEVYQSPWPSSDCTMEITLDSGCYWNISTKIIKDGREDM